jgi:hypothetical protein
MRTDHFCGLKDHCVEVFSIERAIWEYGSWVDYRNIQMKAALAAS